MKNFWNKLKSWFEFSAKTGLYLPMAYDARTQLPSVSLLFAHIANTIAIGGIVTLLMKELKAGVYCSMAYAALMLIFYLIRSLGKVKVDLDDASIELEDGEDDEEKQEQ